MVNGQGALRLWSIRPQVHTSVIDARLREVIGPAADATDGLVAVFVGRRVVDRDEERVVATVWDGEAAMEAACRPGGLLALESDLAGGTVELMPIALAITPQDGPSEPGTLLRIFRGHAQAGELLAYVDAARRGTLEDIANGAGPIGLYLGVPGSDRFVTVSAWTTWERIQIATGGNLQNPVATRHIGHLVSGRVAHYELLPAAEPRSSIDTRTTAGDRTDGDTWTDAPGQVVAEAPAGVEAAPGANPRLPELTLAD